jgi:hypothetical protein
MADAEEPRRTEAPSPSTLAGVAWPQFAHSPGARERLTRIIEIRRSILGSVEGKSDQEPVTTDARTLRVLALLIGELATEAAHCGGVDCMGRKVNGSVQWVTRDRLDAALEQVRLLTSELQLLRHSEFRF